MKLVLLVCLLAVASAANVPFKSCDTGKATVSSLTATPYPPVKGKPVTITASGDLSEQLTTGTYHIDVEFLGITLLKKTGNLCDLSSKFKCPHPSGKISLDVVETIPSEAPDGQYTIILNSTDQNNAELLCIQLSLDISGDAVDEEPVVAVALDDAPVITEELVSSINTQQSSWTAGFNKRFARSTVKEVKNLCGVLPTPEHMKLPVKRDASLVKINMPESFDSREAWPQCPSTKDVRDQGACGSCWAVAAAEAMTDRTCIATNGTHQPYLAAEDILSCCGFFCGMGCDGGYPSGAWSYFTSSGVVTGGPWNSHQGCYPYQIASCDHHVKGTKPPCGQEVPTPSCQKSCQNGATWSSDKHFGATSYSVSSDVESIQKEIMQNGPVEATFTVYSDFPSYKSGVYRHTTGSPLGGHAVKIIGWGSQAGSPYWLIANSWNTEWGDKGFFKILRGQDECGIESGIVAGTVKP